MTDFLSEAKQMRRRLVSWRRDFHMHPELGFEEHRTARIVADHLDRLGYETRTGIAETGIVGLLKGTQPGPVVAVRFDMDALPIQEDTETRYASQVPGRMHACGHDGHVAIGMGLAELLSAYKDGIAGSVKLIFQPAEEGGGGAEKMIAEGVLNDPRPDVFLVTHVWIEKPVGIVDIRTGPVMAAADKWRCTIHGQGGHGALPHQAVDPIVAAAHAVTALQTIVSRNVSPLDTATISVGSIHGGEAFNVIPAQVELLGTVRTYRPSTREKVLKRLEDVVVEVIRACGGTAEFDYSSLTPPLTNDAKVAQIVQQAAESVLGPDHVTSDERTMGSEDAAFFLQRVPGCFFFLGAASPEKGLGASHHNPRFDFDEDALAFGVAVLAEATALYLLK